MSTVIRRIVSAVLFFLTSPSYSSNTQVVQLEAKHVLEGGKVTTNWPQEENVAFSVKIDTPGLEEGSKVPVKSPVNGKVVFSGGNFCKVIILDHAGFSHHILHLDPSSPYAKIGEPVEAGHVIGHLGSTGSYADQVQYQVFDEKSQPMKAAEFSSQEITSFNRRIFFFPGSATKEEIERLIQGIDDPDACGQFGCSTYWP